MKEQIKMPIRWAKTRAAVRRAIQYSGSIDIEARGRQIPLTKTIAALSAGNIPVVADVLEDSEVDSFIDQAEYEFYYPAYYRGRDPVLLKKIREHYMAARLLGLQESDVYLDIASQYSPAPAIYERLFRCQVLRQDLEYPPGRNGRVIGGSAGEMPLEDGSISKMALHCSLEHFEGDEDIALIQDAERVLAVDGRLVIVPLYLSDQYFVVTQPLLWANLPREQWPSFPLDAVIYHSQSSGTRYERYYNVGHFVERLVQNTNMQVSIHSFGDDQFCTPGQMRFAAVFQRTR